MKTFVNVLSALNAIAAVPGKKDKEALVTKHLADLDFERVVVLLLNPFKRFYIKDFADQSAKCVVWYNDAEAYDLFDRLAARTLSGDAARVACGELVASGFPGDLMIRILNKDPKAGFGESTVTKAKKGLLPDFPYMRCALPKDAKFGTWDWNRGVISQEKADGMFATLNKSVGDLSMLSRSGKPFDLGSFPKIVELAKELLDDNTQTQGELLVMNEKGEIQPREIGNGILNKIAQGGEWPKGMSPIYRAWDQIPLSSVVTKGKYALGYANRVANLFNQLQHSSFQELALIDTRYVNCMEEAKAHYAEMLEAGKEGIILSDPNAPWIDSTSKFKIKFKLTATCELRVIGYRPGKGKNEALFGSLICESEDRLLEVAVSGFKDAHRKEIFESFETEWRDAVISVDSNMIMKPSREGKKWSLFLPRFAELRKDKSNADNLEKIKEQFEAAMNSI